MKLKSNKIEPNEGNWFCLIFVTFCHALGNSIVSFDNTISAIVTSDFNWSHISVEIILHKIRSMK